ncbi:glycosyltransferase 87 family protein [Frondihabitans sucicola]|nr:glycosyltransferase 87 family protein [Frondihabitans sucicola]
MPFARSTVVRAAALWLAFVVVHLWLSVAVLHGPHTPLNDVSTVYRDWIFDGAHGLGWVGLDRVWVYPTVALLPMLLAAVAGFVHYSVVWLLLVALLDAGALALLTRGGTRFRAVGWWWLAFLVLLGPIAVGRIDSITIPIAMAGVLVVSRRPLVAGILLALATWIKVWPAALLLALLIAARRRIDVAAGAVGTSVVVVLVAFFVGGNWAAITGFVGQQTGRGLQIEAPVTTFWLWLEALGVSGVSTAFDQTLLTYQVSGPGVSVAANAMTAVMAVVFLGIVLLGVWASRRGVPASHLLAPLGLALTTAFIVTNKVGSPQYEGWLAVPVVLGLVLARGGARAFVAPAILVSVIAALTQVVYPWGYDALVLADRWMVVLITVRNGLLVALLVVALVRVVAAGRAGADTAEARPRGRGLARGEESGEAATADVAEAHSAGVRAQGRRRGGRIDA